MDELRPERDYVEPSPTPAPPGAAAKVETAVAIDRLRELNDALLTAPDGFTIHRKLERVREKRAQMFAAPDERTVDWATAEELALASILADGISIRLTGEDVERGTFSHRHAVFHDATDGRVHVPLQALPQARAAFEIHNSPLSENAVLGFEYGYNIQEPSRLVIWEAQYGDFINGAQVMVDEFLVSARSKWGTKPSLVLLLPHGHEGQGPDHASARPERFLQLAADINMRIANCTTAAQYFHLLRRQAALLQVDPLPLVVLTPEEPAAPRGSGVVATRVRGGAVPHGPAGRAGRDPGRRGPARARVLGQDLRRPDCERTPRRATGRGDLPRRAAVPGPDAGPARDDRCLRQRRRDRLGAGRAREHGRLGLHPSAPAGALGRTDRPARRSSAQRQSRRGLGVAPRAHAAGPRQPGFRRSVAAAA